MFRWFCATNANGFLRISQVHSQDFLGITSSKSSQKIHAHVSYSKLAIVRFYDLFILLSTATTWHSDVILFKHKSRVSAFILSMHHIIWLLKCVKSEGHAISVCNKQKWSAHPRKRPTMNPWFICHLSEFFELRLLILRGLYVRWSLTYRQIIGKLSFADNLPRQFLKIGFWVPVGWFCGQLIRKWVFRTLWRHVM